MKSGEQPVETVTATARRERQGQRYSWIGLAQEIFEVGKKAKKIVRKGAPRKIATGQL
jgi:hypothetical protein